MGAGRFLCVGVPFALTLASLVCLMIATLAGVTDKSLDLFQVNTTNLSISTSSIVNLENGLRKKSITDLTIAALNPSTVTSSASASASSAIASALGTDGASNITASELGLADSYKVSLWAYCATTGKNTTCTKAKFNWAASALNTTNIDSLTSTTSAVGSNATLPSEVKSSLHTFIVVSKWTQIVYIIAIVATAAELILGIFAIFSRAGSCLTWIISGFSTTAVIAASIMATVLSSVTVGAIKSTAKAYGVEASMNTHFLAITWLAVAFSIASGFFWVFTICCCAADHHKSPRKNRNSDSEKLIPYTGAYHKVQDPVHMNEGAYHGQQHGIYNPQHNQPVRTGAYEPYAHAAI
ncbi:SUR7 protein [Rutstroemia sp. NJR-2017a BVV2]|nr:SUR7 protein [Rutstroemia sp. NJR-2017a BVV2]